MLLLVAKEKINLSFAVYGRSLIISLICSRIDYFNAIFTGLPNSTIDRLQSVLYAAPRIITGVRKYDHSHLP